MTSTSDSPAQDAPLYVLGLHAENFMRLTAVDMQIGADGMTIFAGSNAQGKSSAMQAIDATLRGAVAVPAMPVKAGEERGETCVILGPDGETPMFTVRRVYRDSGTTDVSIKAADGSKVTSPQKLLDSFLEATTFNPVEFAFPSGEKTAEGRNKRRLDMLFSVAPIGIDLAAHEAQRKRWFDERTVSKRRQKDLEAVVKDSVASPAADGPEEPEGELVAKIADIQAGRVSAERAAKRVKELEVECAEIQKDIERLQQRLQQRVDEAMVQGNLAMVVLGDADPLRVQLDAMRARNSARRAAAAEVARAEERARQLAMERSHGENLDKKIEELDKLRTDAIAAASFPVKQLTITSDGVLAIHKKDGTVIPVEQASTAEKIRLSFAVMASRNMRLRVALVRNANDLDNAAMVELASIARKKGYQIIAERILPDAAGVSIVFEDGKVKA